MKKKFLFVFTVTLVTLFLGSCSDDKDNDPDQKTEPATCWQIDDGNFLTREDVIFSDDSTSLDINKALLKHIFNSTDIKTGDVVGLFHHGILYYLEVTSVSDKGSTYLSCGIKQIDLTRTLELCQIDMGKIRLSTDFYFDQTQPKRVNNSGEEDANGIINTKCYEEKAEDGTIIYHPMAVTAPVYYEGMNADEEGAAIPNGFIGCYVGQMDEDEYNGFSWSGLVDAVKNVGGKIINAVVEPVKKVYKTTVSTVELLAKVAAGGEVKGEANLVDIDHTFDDQTFSLELSTEGDDDDDDEGMWSKEEWEGSVKDIAEVELDGHVKAKAGAYIVMDFSPLKLEKFSAGVQANADVDLDATVKLGVAGYAERPVVIHRFESRNLKFSIGPIPLIIVVYPELIWKTALDGEIVAFAKFHTTYNMNYDAHLDLAPEVGGSCTSNSPKGEVKFMGAGLQGDGSVETGLFFRSSWEIYGLTGPVFDFGASISAEAEGKVFVDENLNPDCEGSFSINANLGKPDITYAVKFPPLQDISSWLYEHLSWESGSLLNLEPIYVIPILEKGDTEEDE